jgi:hypothetical protein
LKGVGFGLRPFLLGVTTERISAPVDDAYLNFDGSSFSRRRLFELQPVSSRALVLASIETEGGAAPVSGCDASHVSEQARMRNSAEYQFFSIAK